MQLACLDLLPLLSLCRKNGIHQKELNADQQEQSSAQGWLDRKACYDGIGEFPAWPGAMRPPFFSGGRKRRRWGRKEREEGRLAGSEEKCVHTRLPPPPIPPISRSLRERRGRVFTYTCPYTHAHSYNGWPAGRPWVVACVVSPFAPALPTYIGRCLGLSCCECAVSLAEVG